MNDVDECIRLLSLHRFEDARQLADRARNALDRHRTMPPRWWRRR